FYNINSNGFGEFGNTKNEIGFYLGIRSHSKFGKLNMYVDLFNTPFPRSGVDFPSSGTDFLINYSTKINSGSSIILKYKREIKESNSLSAKRKMIQDIIKTNYKIDLKYKVSPNIYSTTRIEFVEYNSKNKNESGFSTFQQLKLNLYKDLYILSRITFFDTDSYNSRIYQFENDLQGLMTNKVLFEEGLRWFVLMNISPVKSLKLSIKYSDTFKPNKKDIGSGNSKIRGNTINQVGLQLDFSF
ncbi:MAG: hypothetical protein R3250_09665, partial [Melioribacteraceae bacterium]|nr:hypothetical protein [Melioribacteraceae bacterium]